MQRIFYLLLSVILFTQCRADLPPSLNQLNFDGHSVIKFHVRNLSVGQQLPYYYNIFFPFGQVSGELAFEKDSTYIIDLNIMHPIYLYIYDKNNIDRIILFVKPNETLNIEYNGDTSIVLQKRVLLDNDKLLPSNYLTNGSLNYSPGPYMTEDVKSYNLRIDTITTKRLEALNDFEKLNRIPNWFLDFERKNILYKGASDKMCQFSQRNDFYSQSLDRPINFIEELNVDLDDEDAIFTEDYLNILFSICSQKFDTLLMPRNFSNEAYLQYVNENINEVSKNIQKNLSFFLATRVSSLLSLKYLNKIEDLESYLTSVDSIVTRIKPLCSDTTLYNEIVKYRDSQVAKFKSQNTLNKGDKAPPFILTDVTGNLVKLSDYKGKVILLNFWATWCAPCVTSIKEKSQILKADENSNLVIINISLDYDNTKWADFVNKSSLGGINLFCKGNWKDQVKKSYNVYSIPHSTVIDKQGLVVSNNIKDMSVLKQMIGDAIMCK